MPVPNSVFRLRARQALRNHWQTALLIALIVNLPSLLVQGITAFTGNDPLVLLESRLLVLTREGNLTDAGVMAIMESISRTTGVWVMAGLSVLAWLITPALSLGMNHWTLDRLRGQEEGVSTVFSRLRWALKSIGLRIWIAFKILLWTLPGAALFILAAWKIAPEAAAGSLSFITLLGTAAMLVPGIMAALRYAFSFFILSDTPEKGVFASVRESIRLARNNTLSLFSLYLSFILWYLLLMLLSSLSEGLFGSVVSLMVQMLGSLAIGVYLSTSVGAYFLFLCGESAEPVPQTAADSGDSETPMD